MENFYRLLFELSNEDRYNILCQLLEGETNIVTVSKKLDLTSQEVSRQVSRLSEVSLVKKTINGIVISDYGKYILKNMKGLQFITKNLDYFTSHNVSHLPLEFVNRIGDLEESKDVNDISSALYMADKITKEAEEYVWTITDQYQITNLLLIKDAFERNLQVKNIESKKFRISQTIREAWTQDNYIELSKSWEKARNIGSLKEKIIEKPLIYLYMSEKEVAGLSFPSPDGKFDYQGFSGDSVRLHKFCEDLFNYYWDAAKNRSVVVDELYKWINKNQDALKVFKQIAEKGELVNHEKLVTSLENNGLIVEDGLTHLGDIVYGKLETKTPYEVRT